MSLLGLLSFVLMRDWNRGCEQIVCTRAWVAAFELVRRCSPVEKRVPRDWLAWLADLGPPGM